LCFPSIYLGIAEIFNFITNGEPMVFATGDMPTVLGLMHPKIEWKKAENNSLADGNPYIGPDAILKGVFARLRTLHV